MSVLLLFLSYCIVYCIKVTINYKIKEEFIYNETKNA